MGSALLLRRVRQVRRSAAVVAYRRVRHVVDRDRCSAVLVFLFAMLRESFAALPARRYFALMTMYAALAFRTVLVLALFQPPANAQALAVPTPAGLVIRTLTVLVVIRASLRLCLLPSVDNRGGKEAAGVPLPVCAENVEALVMRAGWRRQPSRPQLPPSMARHRGNLGFDHCETAGANFFMVTITI